MALHIHTLGELRQRVGARTRPVKQEIRDNLVRKLRAGDTLFPGGPGNTQKDPVRFERIISSIRERLFNLPDETVVYPGHGLDTTIGRERPHLDEWIARGW